MRGRKWTEQEDSLLRQLVQQHGKQWSVIASKMENRTASQVSSRWEKCIDPSLLKGPFSHEEDQIVIEYVKQHGPSNWPRLAEKLKVRSPKQCRERWFNHLDPNLSKESWTREEDLIIFEQHNKLGPKWSAISHFLPHRSDNAIKNRWNSSISKRIQYNSNGQPILLEDSIKKSQKTEKTKARPYIQPLPIPPTPLPSRWNVEITSKHGRIAFPQQQIFLPQMAPIPTQISPQQPSIQTISSVPMDQQQIQIPPGQIFNYPIQFTQMQQPPQQTAQQIQITQPPQAPAMKETTGVAAKSTVPIPAPPTAPPQATPQQQPANASKPAEGESFPFTPFGASTPLSFELFSPTSPNPIFFQSEGMSPFKRSDRNVFK